MNNAPSYRPQQKVDYQPRTQPQPQIQPQVQSQGQQQFVSPVFFDPSKAYMNPYGNGFGGYQQLDMSHNFMNMYNQMQAFYGLNNMFSQLTGQPQVQPQAQGKQEQSSTSTVDAKSSTASK